MTKIKEAGITWFDDRIWSVASGAAVELDMIRLARPYGDWNCRILASWLLSLSRGEAPYKFFAASVVDRSARAAFPDCPRMTKCDEVFAFAGDAGRALSQSIWFDPSLNGWPRSDVMSFCGAVSRFSMADDFYRKSHPGSWRGHNYYAVETGRRG